MINFFKNIGLRIVSFFMMLLLLSILIGTINFIGSLFSNESSPKKEIKKEIKKDYEKNKIYLPLYNVIMFDKLCSRKAYTRN